MFKSAATFWRFKAVEFVLNVLTFKVPSLTRRCFLQFTMLQLATDSDEMMVYQAQCMRHLTCFSTSHTMMNHDCW